MEGGGRGGDHKHRHSVLSPAYTPTILSNHFQIPWELLPTAVDIPLDPQCQSSDDKSPTSEVDKYTALSSSSSFEGFSTSDLSSSLTSEGSNTSYNSTTGSRPTSPTNSIGTSSVSRCNLGSRFVNAIGKMISILWPSKNR